MFAVPATDATDCVAPDHPHPDPQDHAVAHCKEAPHPPPHAYVTDEPDILLAVPAHPAPDADPLHVHPFAEAPQPPPEGKNDAHAHPPPFPHCVPAAVVASLLPDHPPHPHEAPATHPDPPQPPQFAVIVEKTELPPLVPFPHADVFHAHPLHTVTLYACGVTTNAALY